MRKNFPLLIIILLLTACNVNKTSKNNDLSTPIIAVTIEPQRYFVEAIAGDKFKVICAVPKGTSPETYDPTPQQLIELGDSKAYLRIGHIGFEQVWMDRLTDNAPHLQVFDTSKDVNLILETGEKHRDHHHPGGIEPHIWSSTNNALIIARNTYKALCSLDKANEPLFLARYDSLCRQIMRTDTLIREALSKPETPHAFVIYHPALSYFARDYGLHQISIEEGGKEPSPAHLKRLIDLCRQEKVRVIFVQPEFDRRNAEIIAQEIGAEVVSIHPLNYDWKTEMLETARVLSNPSKNRNSK